MMIVDKAHYVQKVKKTIAEYLIGTHCEAQMQKESLDL